MDLRLIFGLAIGMEMGLSFFSVPATLDSLMPIYGVSYAGVSVLLSAILWTHAAMQIPSGLIVDRTGLRFALIFSLSCLLAGGVIPAVSPSLILALVGRVITGIGTGLAFISVMKLMAVYNPPQRIGAFQSLMAGCFSIGGILGYLVTPYLVEFGWQWVYLVYAAPTPILLFAAIRMDWTASNQTVTASLVENLSEAVKSPASWICGWFHAISYGSGMVLGAWLPTYMSDVWGGVGASGFAWVGAVVMLIIGAGRISGGYLFLITKPLYLIRITLVFIFFSYLGLYFFHVPVSALTFAFIIAWFSSVNFGAIFHEAGRFTDPSRLGAVYGVVNFLANVGAISFTLLFGLLKDYHGVMNDGFIILAALTAGATAVSYLLKTAPRKTA